VSPIGFGTSFQDFLNFRTHRRAPLFQRTGNSSQRFFWQALFLEKVLNPFIINCIVNDFLLFLIQTYCFCFIFFKNSWVQLYFVCSSCRKNANLLEFFVVCTYLFSRFFNHMDKRDLHIHFFQIFNYAIKYQWSMWNSN